MNPKKPGRWKGESMSSAGSGSGPPVVNLQLKTQPDAIEDRGITIGNVLMVPPEMTTGVSATEAEVLVDRDEELDFSDHSSTGWVSVPKTTIQAQQVLPTIPSKPVSRGASLHSDSRREYGSVEDWNRLRSLRIEALRLRLTLQKQRKIVHGKQVAKDLADEAYMKFARENSLMEPTSTLDEEISRLEKLYGELQFTRDEYGPILEEYKQDEEALDAVEFEMMKVENQLFSLLFGSTPGMPLLTSESSQYGRSAAPFSSSIPFPDLVAGIQEKFEPLHTKYLSRLGDLDLAKERLDNLKQEMENLLTEQDTLSRAGLKLRPEVEAILRELPSRESRLRTEIAEIESEVGKLKLECVEAGIDVEGSDDGSGYSRSFYDEDIRQEKIYPPGEDF